MEFTYYILWIKKSLYTFTIWTLQNCFDKSYDNVPTIISKSSFSLIDICSNNNKRIIQIHIFSNNKRILKLNIIFRTQNRIIYNFFNYFTISLWSKRRFITKTYNSQELVTFKATHFQYQTHNTIKQHHYHPSNSQQPISNSKCKTRSKTITMHQALVCGPPNRYVRFRRPAETYVRLLTTRNPIKTPLNTPSKPHP